MTVVLHCAAKPKADFSMRLTAEEWLAWEKSLAQAPAEASRLSHNPGPGSPVLCSTSKSAVEYASRLYPDRRIEVKAGYADPEPAPVSLGLRLRPGFWRFLSKAKILLGRGPEAPEILKRRVIEASSRLIELSKAHGESAMVAEPMILMLVAFKLAGIGFRGPFWRWPRYGQSLHFEFPSK
jgi:hypothetical protein